MGKFIGEFEPGEVYRSQGRTITDADLTGFIGLSWDTNPIHTYDEYAKSGPFGKRIAHGALILSCATGLLSRNGWFEETVIGFLSIENWVFKAPTAVGDTIHLAATVVQAKRSDTKPDRGVLKLQIRVLNQHKTVVQEGVFNMLMRACPKGSVA